MKIQFLGHASFLIVTESGTRIVTDPVDPEGYPGQLNYNEFNKPADIVTISHEHKDHGSTRVVKGSPIIIKGNGKFQANEVEFLGVATYHDKKQGAERGTNTVFVISADDLRIAHMGDLGHVLTGDQAAEIGSVDVALIPVGGHFTIGPEEAQKVADQISADIVIPMHYRTEKCDFPIAPVDDFLAGKSNVTHLNSSVLEVSKANMPPKQQIVVLKHAL